MHGLSGVLIIYGGSLPGQNNGRDIVLVFL